MCQLNTFGRKVAPLEGVKALTDVTGFGLLGHLSEICEGSGVGAVVEFDKVPVVPEAIYYLEAGAIPGGTLRNYDSYGHKVHCNEGELNETQKHILCDPQTSGGLLIAVTPEAEHDLLKVAKKEGITLQPFGVLTEQHNEKLIEVV